MERLRRRTNRAKVLITFSIAAANGVMVCHT